MTHTCKEESQLETAISVLEAHLQPFFCDTETTKKGKQQAQMQLVLQQTRLSHLHCYSHQRSSLEHIVKSCMQHHALQHHSSECMQHHRLQCMQHHSVQCMQHQGLQHHILECSAMVTDTLAADTADDT